MKLSTEQLEQEVERISMHISDPKTPPYQLDGLVRARSAVLKQLKEMEPPPEPAASPPAPREAGRRPLRKSGDVPEATRRPARLPARARITGRGQES